MKLERKELLAALKACKPALAEKDPLTQLLCLWFSGQSLFAYNNVIGIDAPLETDFKGGVQGALLFGLVSNSLAKQAEITVDGSDFDAQVWSPEQAAPGIPAQVVSR